MKEQRQIVIDSARQLAIKCKIAEFSLNKLLNADEVFLTNSVREIIPARRIGKIKIKEYKTRPVTRQIERKYQEIVNNNIG